MTACPDPSEMAAAALSGETPPDAVAHLAACPACRAEYDRLRALDARLRTAHARFHGDTAAGRARLLAALAVRPADAAARRLTVRHRFGGNPLRRLVTAAVAAGVLALAGLFWGVGGGAALALDDVARAVRAAQTVQFTAVSTHAGPGAAKERLVVRRAADGNVRVDGYDGNTRTDSHFLAPDGSALVLDHAQKTYRTEVPRANDLTRGLWALFLRAFADVPADGARRLPDQDVSGRRFPGFEWPVRALDADLAAAPDAVLRVWADPATGLPATFELVMFDGQRLASEEIVWNAPFAAADFDRTPPAGYAEQKPFHLDAEREAQIAFAFQTYAELMGRYPRMDVLYPDLLGWELEQKLGLDGPAPEEPTKEYWQRYDRAQRAGLGFTWLWGVRQTKLELRYYGKTVGPNQRDRVLVRWREADGGYRVLFGDLRFATVGAAALHRLEAR